MPTPAFRSQFVPSPLVFGGQLIAEPLQIFEPVGNQVSWATSAVGIGSLLIAPFTLQQVGVFSVVDVYVSNAYSATNAGSSHAHTLNFSAGVYSKMAGTLQLVGSGSAGYNFTVTGSTSSISYQGLRNLTIPVTLNLFEGNYWIAIASSTSSAGNAIAAAFSNVVHSFAGNQSLYSGVFGQSTAASQQAVLGLGALSVTTASMPASIAFSDIVGSANANTCRPVVNLRNYSA